MLSICLNFYPKIRLGMLINIMLIKKSMYITTFYAKTYYCCWIEIAVTSKVIYYSFMASIT